MNILNYTKLFLTGAVSAIAYLLGGFDTILGVLAIMILLDYVTGVLGAIYLKSVSSDIGYRGIIKKAGVFIIIGVSHIVGVLIKMPDIRTIVISFYIANEAISIVENWGKMGLPLPQKLKDVLEQLKKD